MQMKPRVNDFDRDDFSLRFVVWLVLVVVIVAVRDEELNVVYRLDYFCLVPSGLFALKAVGRLDLRHLRYSR